MSRAGAIVFASGAFGIKASLLGSTNSLSSNAFCASAAVLGGGRCFSAAAVACGDGDGLSDRRERSTSVIVSYASGRRVGKSAKVETSLSVRQIRTQKSEITSIELIAFWQCTHNEHMTWN